VEQTSSGRAGLGADPIREPDPPSSSPPDLHDPALRAVVEGALATVPGVLGVRVVPGVERPIDELHVLADLDEPTEQVVRDVQTVLTARFGVHIDQRIISVVQWDERSLRRALTTGVETHGGEFAREASAAYEAELRQQLERHGVPGLEPGLAGRRAALLTAAGVAWTNDVGPFYDTAGVRVVLGGITKQAVSERVRNGRLLALALAPDGSHRDRLVYPAWQFRPGVLPHLPAVLAAAGYDLDRPLSGWTIAAWLAAPDPVLLGSTPVAMLEAGRSDEVLELAREIRASLGTDERAAARAASR
jgi:hypothetical protein